MIYLFFFSLRVQIVVSSSPLFHWSLIHDHAAIENRIDSVSYSHPETLELILGEISETLHENHYLITDTMRRLIDIYGVEENFQYASVDRIKVG